MTKKALNAIDIKEKKWKVYRDNKNDDTLDVYRQARNYSVKTIREAKYNFEKSLANEVKNGETASFYAYLRSSTNIKEEVSRVTKPDGSLTTTKKDTADVINQCLQQVFVREGQEETPQLDFQFEGEPLDDILFSIQDVYDILSNLKVSSAPGPCTFHPKIMNECAESLAPPLYSIYRDSLDTGKLPNIWKTANVSPIYKKGRKTDPLNYRPISLTSVPCKVMERIIGKEIMRHLENNKLLSKHQHGFRSKRSCLTQLLEYFSEIHNCLDESDPVDAIYLDCQKAFDTVPHKRLLAKLKAYGITGKVLNWIKDFLKDRTQRVVVKGVFSDPLRVWSGVPQGSVLGPILFLIYINDLLVGITSSGKLFADDSKLFRRIKNIADRIALQEDLLKLQEWSNKWLLKFNEGKCKVMHIGRSNPHYDYQLNNNLLQTTMEEKDLGVYVTPDWKSAAHVGKVAAKANSMVGRINRTFSYMDADMFKALYPSMIRSHMEYAAQAWSPHLRKDINLLEQVQRRATRLVQGLQNETYEQRKTILGLTSLEDRRTRGDLIEVFKIMHGMENVQRDQFFTMEKDKHKYPKRGNGLRIWVPSTKTARRRKFFDIRIINLWNKLPADVVRKQHISTFKLGLDRHLATMRRGTLHEL